jgi:hypothetical protein
VAGRWRAGRAVADRCRAGAVASAGAVRAAAGPGEESGGAGELGGPPEGKRRRRSWAGGVAGANGGRRRFPNGGGGANDGWLAVEVKTTEKKHAERKVSCGYFLARRQDLWR